MDTWQTPPQVVDQIPLDRAELMREVKDALEKGRGLREEDAQKKAERDAKRKR